MPHSFGPKFWNEFSNGSLITGITASGLARVGGFFTSNPLGFDQAMGLGYGGLGFVGIAKLGRNDINDFGANILGGMATSLLAVSFHYGFKLSPSVSFLVSSIVIALASRNNSDHAPQPQM